MDLYEVVANHSQRSKMALAKVIGTAGLAMAIVIGAAGSAGITDVITPGSVSAQESIQAQLTVADVAEAANPAVVTVTNLQAVPEGGSFPRESQFPGGPEAVPGEEAIRPVGTGSGFIIDEEGHVVTNNHVVAGGTAFEITFFDGTSVDAELVGSDPYQDVAVLKLVLDVGQSVPGIVDFGDSDQIRAGDPVIAIGNPFGEYANSVTNGSVNGVERALDSGAGFSLPNLIQHDAAIYPGNSGGPLLNMEGQVIGMNVAKAYSRMQGQTLGEGLNFAIDSNAVQEIVAELIADGQFERSYLGIQAETTSNGIGVLEVQSDGPAADAGLQSGDMIVAIDGEEIDEPNEGLDLLIFERRPGDEVVLTVERAGESLDVSLTLGERPEVVT
jgi:S1-C subfamily serine protease